METLGAKAQVNFPGWQYTMYVVTHHCWGNYALSTLLHREGVLEACPAISQTPPHVPFTFVNCNLYLVSVINHEYNNFAEFCESF